MVCSEENNSKNLSLLLDALSDELLVIISESAINCKTPQHNIARCNKKFYTYHLLKLSKIL